MGTGAKEPCPTQCLQYVQQSDNRLAILYDWEVSHHKECIVPSRVWMYRTRVREDRWRQATVPQRLRRHSPLYKRSIRSEPSPHPRNRGVLRDSCHRQWSLRLRCTDHVDTAYSHRRPRTRQRHTAPAQDACSSPQVALSISLLLLTPPPSFPLSPSSFPPSPHPHLVPPILERPR